jgi:anti-anti-sigma factor
MTIETAPTPEGLVIKPNRNVLGYWAEQLLESVRAAVHAGERRIIVDLAAVDMVDSKGLAVFMLLHNDLQERGGALTVVTHSPQLQQLFAVARLSERFCVTPELA